MATVVLLHPFPQDHRFWDPVAGRLRDAGHAVMAPDLPGFGDRPREPGWTMDAEADRLAGRVPDGAVVVGLSMGGYLAEALAARHPARVGRLVLADTRSNAEDAAGLAQRHAIAARLRSDGSQEFLDAFIPNVLGPGAGDQVRARLREIAEAQSADAMADGMEAIGSRGDATPLLRALPVPALVMCGEHDRGAPPALHAEMAAMIPEAQLVVIGGAGHMSALEEPDEFADLLLQFIEE